MKHGWPTINYSQHCNTHMHAGVIRDIKEIIHESYNFPYGVEPTSIVMNAWQTRPDAHIAQTREDIKIQQANSVQDIYKQIGERDCFSISDAIFSTRAIEDFFELEYGITSMFEGD